MLVETLHAIGLANLSALCVDLNFAGTTKQDPLAADKQWDFQEFLSIVGAA